MGEEMSIQAADAFMGIFGFKRVKSVYGCQTYDIDRPCRFDRRAIDRNCDGCPRETDREYLESMGLWVEGVSHKSEIEYQLICPRCKVDRFKHPCPDNSLNCPIRFVSHEVAE